MNDDTQGNSDERSADLLNRTQSVTGELPDKQSNRAQMNYSECGPGHVVETRDASKRTADKEAEEHIASLAVLPETSTQEQTIRALSPSPAKAVVTDEHSSQERKSKTS